MDFGLDALTAPVNGGLETLYIQFEKHEPLRGKGFRRMVYVCVKKSNRKALAYGPTRKIVEQAKGVFQSLGIDCCVLNASGGSVYWTIDGTCHKR